MSKNQKKNKSKPNYPIGKQTIKTDVDKKSDFYLKHKSTIWTIIILVILTIFFIANNTRKVPEHGPFPPNYQGSKSLGDSIE